MEKENLDNFLENRQSYMMDNNLQQLNVAGAGDGVVGGVQAELVSGVAGEILGGKYDEHHEEHDVGDDDELKYAEEVQQSEKQQQQQLQAIKNIGLDDDVTYKSNELAEKETSYNATNELGNGNGGFLFGDDVQKPKQQEHHDLFKLGNGHDTNGHDIVNINEDFGNRISTGFEDKLNMMESELDGFKNDGDFSSTSNVAEFAEGLVPQVNVEIETKVEHHEMVDEEDPSSLATNTTNGTSSLSENVPHQAVIAIQANTFDDLMASMEDKESSEPITPQRPSELDLEQAHYQLNPDAKEFIPSFGSNPASPTSPFATGIPQNEPVLSEVMETEMYFGQAPIIVPRHLLDDDDVIAGSPRKGKGDNNMDSFPLPRELAEFEKEAETRPHGGIGGLDQRDEVMTPDQAIQQLPFDDIVSQDKENHAPADSIDFRPSSFMDHGPETCVDLETDLDLQPSRVLSSVETEEDDVMKRSMYVASDDAIEDVLNSVQPIPTEIDSLNNSFIEESATESAANELGVDKELLQVEEKEHVSHSPSTEEIQMNSQNIINSSNKDIPQLPIDIDNAINVLDSLYGEQQDQEQQVESQDEEPFKKEQILQDHCQTQFKELLQDEQQQQIVEGEVELPNQSELKHEELHEQKENEEKIRNFSDDFEPLKRQEEEQSIVDEAKLKEHALDDNELQHDHELTQDPMPCALPTEEAEKSLIADTNHLVANDSFLDNTSEIQEHRQEMNESYSPFKISDQLSNAHAVESFDDDALENQEESNLNDIEMTPPFIADEKHLFEETKEPQLFSVSGLEKEMDELILNNTDDLSQAEEIATAVATDVIQDISENVAEPDADIVVKEELYEQLQEAIATTIAADAIEDISENIAEPNTADIVNGEAYEHQGKVLEEIATIIATDAIEDVSENIAEPDTADIVKEEVYEQQQEQVQEQLAEKMFADDSFAKHEQECLEQYQKELQHNQEMDAEVETKPDSVNEYIESPKAEPIESPKVESIESPIDQQHQPELASEMVAVEEPIVEAKNTSPLFTNEKTEIVNETKTEERQELPLFMVPETAPAELLEPPMETRNETENISYQEEQSQQATENVKAEIIKEPEVEELKEKEKLEPVKEEEVATPQISADVPVEAAIVAAAAAVTATAAVATKVAETANKPISKTTTTAAAKPKVAATTTAKKPTETAKKPTGVAAKPRTVAAKPTATTTEKKPIAPTTTFARKPLSGTTTTATKLVAKSSTTTSTTRTVTAASKTTTTFKPTTTTRTVTSSTAAARKPTSTNGPLAKPRPTTAPAKPTTLGLPATNGAPKSKTLSPRTAATSQLRKSAPATTAAKSPVKPTATNGVTKTTSSTLASRTKTTTTTVSTTAATAKTFTARPAPKFTSSSSTSTNTTTTARRVAAVGASTLCPTTTTTTKSTSTALRKSTPTKPAVGKLHTPTKATTMAGGLKQKTPTSKTASPAEKPAPIRKPVDKTAAVTNGEANAKKELNGTAEEQYLQSSIQNGDLKAVKIEQQNGDSSIPMQTESPETPFLGTTSEQTPMDLINA